MNCCDDTIKDGETGENIYAGEKYKVALGERIGNRPFA
jgi:hypothetical protein